VPLQIQALKANVVTVWWKTYLSFMKNSVMLADGADASMVVDEIIQQSSIQGSDSNGSDLSSTNESGSIENKETYSIS
jgi:hypothetical protein